MESDFMQSKQAKIETAEEVIWQVQAKPSQPYRVVMEVNGRPLMMEIHMGAAVSFIFEETKENLFPFVLLGKYFTQVVHIRSESITVLRQMEVEVG